MRAATGLDADDALRGERLVLHQELRILCGVDVIRHHAEAVLVTQCAAQGQGQGGFAGTDRTADADAKGLSAHMCFPLFFIPAKAGIQ